MLFPGTASCDNASLFFRLSDRIDDGGTHAFFEGDLVLNEMPDASVLAQLQVLGQLSNRAVAFFDAVVRAVPPPWPDARSWSRNAGLCDEPLRGRF
jgi:hypothetical protein